MNTFKINEDVYEILSFSKDEIEVLKNKYIEILNQNVSGKEFSRQTKAIITINGKQIYTNAYSINLPKEKMNKIQVKFLSELKENET